MKVLAVIPARSGSKQIKRKNLRFLQGKPLIAYMVEKALESGVINDVVVSTDDHIVMDYILKSFGDKEVVIHNRPEWLAKDETPLDPVVYHAMHYIEKIKNVKYDIVVTLQPTSPLLKVRTLDRAITDLIRSDYDTSVAVTDDAHLRWEIREGQAVPLYKQRLNRQWLSPVYRETGAFVISKRHAVTSQSRFGNKITVFPLSKEEAVDIDDEIDWFVAKAFLERLRIVFVVTGNKSIGTGHVHRVLSLADAFLGNCVHVLAYNSDDNIVDIFDRHGYYVNKCQNMECLLYNISVHFPDIVINDILDTNLDYIIELKNRGYFVVNFEDLGDGGKVANLVFNALYELSTPPENHRFGPKYVCLREDFLLYSPASFRDIARTLLVTFGGVDENNLTFKTLNVVPQLLETTTLNKVIVIIGAGYTNSRYSNLMSLIDSMSENVKNRIVVLRAVDNMAQLMQEADVAVTSNGRTVYELTAMGVPSIVISQNDRETLHLFSRYSTGLRYLGIACNVSGESIVANVKEIVGNRALRFEMRKALLAVDVRSGIERIQHEIVHEYRRWKNGKGNNHWSSYPSKGANF